MTAIVSINHNNMTSWTIISGTFRTFCKKSYNFLQFIKNTEEQKYWCYDSPLSCRGCSTIAQQSFFYVAKDNFTHSPPPRNASFCTDLCLRPLHGQVSLDKGSLAQCCGVCSVARCESWGGIRAGASTFLSRGLRLRYWVVIVQVIIVGLRWFSARLLI